MPNHCSNTLTVCGDKTELTRFWNAVQIGGGEIKLTSLYPMPDELSHTTATFFDATKTDDEHAEQIVKWAELISRYGHQDWYSWALDNWGTKWGDYEHSYAELSDEHVEIRYMTAWCPFDNKFWHHVSQQFPTLTFVIVYDEPGMVFCGASCYRNGETVAERYIDDYTQVLGEIDWDDQDSQDQYWDRHSDLLATLEMEVFPEP